MKITFDVDWKVWIFAIGMDFRRPRVGGIMIGPLVITIERKR